MLRDSEPPDPPAVDEATGALAFRLAVQRNRAAIYVLAGTLGLLGRAAGVLYVSVGAVAALVAVGVASAALLGRLARRTKTGEGMTRLDAASLALDVLFLSWAVAATGGFSSPWYVWYLGAVGAAAFMGGRRATAVVSAADTAAYLGTLALLGEVRWADGTLAVAFFRMLFLHAAALFFLVGVADLREKRRTIKRLQENESRKVAELTRLTAALDQASRELADANVRIREADRLKTQFLANMSHELRTPLNSILGFSEILKTRLAETLPPKQLGFLGHIHASGQHLLGLINDLLDLSKIEAGKMEVAAEPVALRALVDGVCHVAAGMAEKPRVTFDVDVPDDLPPLSADPVKLKQILYNLLSNAVKFSPEGAAVTVRARAVPAAESLLGAESVVLSVVDRGIGIAPEDHAIVFEEFRQADGTTARRYGGTGLGLALVRSLVGLHGGRVDLTSDLGKGSAFTVTLPLGGLAALPARPPAAPFPSPDGSPVSGGRPGSGERHRILVIEDDPTAYESLGRLLVEAGYVPLRARSGEEAVTLAHALRPAAITLDLVLPGLDGWSVLKTLKANHATREIPVVIVSIVENPELGAALGADDSFVKPVERERLLARLAELVRRAEPAEKEAARA